MKPYKDKIIVIDYKLIAYSLGFHAKRPLSTVIPQLINILRVNNIYSNKLVFATDATESKRVKLYPQYKKHRKDLLQRQSLTKQKKQEQFEEDYQTSLNYLNYFGNAVIINGIEADDIASVLCSRFKNTDTEIILVSSDIDWCSFLFSDNIKMFHLKRRKIITASTVEDELGLTVEGIFYSQVFAGSTKENVKGIYGFGETTFKKQYNKVRDTTEDTFTALKKIIKEEVVDKELRGVRLPKNTTYEEMVNLNYALFKPMSFDDLEEKEKELFLKGINNKKKLSYTELSYELLQFNTIIHLDSKQREYLNIL